MMRRAPSARAVNTRVALRARRWATALLWAGTAVAAGSEAVAQDAPDAIAMPAAAPAARPAPAAPSPSPATLPATPAPHRTPITLRDDRGQTITLAGPARRAITAAPHATELVYAAGAGDYLAGTAQGSDYPSAARALPSLGTTLRPNLEIAAALAPDLLIAWQPAVPDPLHTLMQRLGVPVFYSDPRTLAAIPDAVQTMGHLFGTKAQADAAAQALRARLATLSARYSQRAPVRVFIQAGLQPIYTLSDHSIISDAVRLCGGVNVFGDLRTMAPQVSVESVLAAQPDAVIAGVTGADEARDHLRTWQRHGLPAARQGHVFGLDADALYRPGPRLIDMAEQICQDLDQIRQAG